VVEASLPSREAAREGVSPKPILAALRGEARRPPPVWLMRQAGRYLPEYRAIRATTRSFLEFCYTPELAVEVTLQPVRRFGLDAAILFSDILVVPDALGAEVAFVEGEGPRLTPIAERRDLERLSTARQHQHLAPVYEAVRGIRRELPDGVALIGFSGAPWTLAAYMVEGRGSREFAVARRLARREPAVFAELVGLLAQVVEDHLCAQAEAGAEAVQLFDSWAGALPEEERERWCVEPARRDRGGVQGPLPGRAGDRVPARDRGRLRALRARGALRRDRARHGRADGLGGRAAAGGAADDGRSLCLQGNLDPLALLGPVPTMLAEAGRIVAAAGDRPLVFNLGHGVTPETPPEAVGAWQTT
jgi:uroporphyrinogen decarboxylase